VSLRGCQRVVEPRINLTKKRKTILSKLVVLPRVIRGHYSRERRGLPVAKDVHRVQGVGHERVDLEEETKNKR